MSRARPPIGRLLTALTVTIRLRQDVTPDPKLTLADCDRYDHADDDASRWIFGFDAIVCNRRDCIADAVAKRSRLRWLRRVR